MTTRIDALTGRRYQGCKNSGCLSSMPALLNGYCPACQMWTRDTDDVDAWAHDWRMEQLDEQQDRSYGYGEE